MIKGIQEHLFAVLRDILFIDSEVLQSSQIDLNTTEGGLPMPFSTSYAMPIFCNRRSIRNMVVCWGGHSISGVEYDWHERGRLSAWFAWHGYLHWLWSRER